MMRRGVLGFTIGIVFGLVLCMSGMSSPEVIRQALLFQSAYLYFFMFSAVAVATVGTRLVTRNTRPERRPLRERPEHRHIVGALVFGLGWGVADACPGPVLTHVGQGIGWGLFTFAGVVTGVWLFHRQARYADRAEGPVRVPEGTEASPVAS